MISEKEISEIKYPEEPVLTDEELQDIDEHFFSWVDLSKKEKKITEIFKKHNSKFSEENKALFLLPIGHVYEPEDFRIFFEYEKKLPLENKKEYNFVYDCLNFICYEHNNDPANNEEEYKNKILYDFSLLNEKGTLMLLLDVYFTKNFFKFLIKALGSEYDTKLFINFYFMEKRDFLFVITIQKMAKVDKPINISETKVLITDYFSNVSPHFLCSKLISEMDSYLQESFIKMQNYYIQNQINYSLAKNLNPGKYLLMYLKTSPLNPGIDFIVTITDNSTNLDYSNNKTIAVVILYEMSQELNYLSDNSFDVISKTLNIGRIITLECALLNPMNMKEIGLELMDEIEMLKPKSFKDKVEIKGWNDKSPKYLVNQGDNFLIRDCEEKSKIFFRELIYIFDNNISNAIMAKLKIKFVPIHKIKQNEDYQMDIQEKLKDKKIIKCIDDNYIPGFYEKTIICLAFYLDLEKLPENNIRCLGIGTGLGIMSFFLYKLYKGNCEVDNIEKNNWIYDLGIKFFGLKNYDKNGNRINWIFEDAINYINKTNKLNKNNNNVDNDNSNDKSINIIESYDLIFNEINDINPKELSSPSPAFFTDEFLNNINQLINKNGIYIVNSQTRSFKVIYENYLQIAKHFKTIYTIPSENRLGFIFICFKEELNEEKCIKLFHKNKEIILKNDVIDSSLVEPIYKEVISKVKDIHEEVKKMEEFSIKM